MHTVLMYGDNQSHQKLWKYELKIIHHDRWGRTFCSNNKVSVYNRCYGRVQCLHDMISDDNLVTFIIQMHNTKTCVSAPPFGDRYVCKIKLELTNKIKIAKSLRRIHECCVGM